MGCLIIFCVLTWFSIDLILWNTLRSGILVFLTFYSELIYFHFWVLSFSNLTVACGHLKNVVGFYKWQVIIKISKCNGQFSERRTSKLGEICRLNFKQKQFSVTPEHTVYIWNPLMIVTYNWTLTCSKV